MADGSPVARLLYRWIAFVAIPGAVWSAFEMYVLTLWGAQMMFFSIVHTMPALVVIVLVGVVGLVLWAFQSLVALLLAAYRVRIGVRTSALVTFAVLTTLHLALLFWYEEWSSSSLRVAVCILGLATIAALIALSVRHLRKTAV